MNCAVLRSVCLAMTLLCGLVPRGAWAKAQPATTINPQRERARKLFAQAELHFEAGSYKAALADYNKAFTLTNLRGFLLNIGHCHAKLGNNREATKYYRFYLQRTPRSDQRRPAVERAIAQLTGKQAAGRGTPKPPQPQLAQATRPKPVALEASITPEATPVAIEQPPLPTLALTETNVEPLVVRTADLPTAPPREHPQRWVWAAIGASLLAAGTTWVLLNQGGQEHVREGSIGTLAR